MNVPNYAEAYCFECKGLREIAAIRGIRKAPSPRGASYVAVRLACGCDRARDDRLTMSTYNLLALKAYLWSKYPAKELSLTMKD